MPFRSRLVLLAFGLSVSTSFTFSAETLTIPSGSKLQVQIEQDVPMKVGRSVRGKTVYPLYVENRLTVPAGTEVAGKIVALEAVSKKTKLNARLDGDFTPLHQPEIKFTQLVLAGSEVSLKSVPTSHGVEVVRFQSLSAGQHTSLMKKLWADAVGRGQETVRTFTAPGKKERARRMLYAELPYHPELVQAGTQYEVELASAVTVPAATDVLAKAEKKVDSAVKLSAALLDGVDSKSAVRGTKVRAIVTEPLLNANREVQVPQGTLLLGEITQAHAAGKWGKGGVLRFSFRELKFPEGFTQRVHGAPTSVDADRNAALQLDAEGGVKPGHKGAAIPLAMGLLALNAAGEDEGSVLHTAGTSNGFRLIGRLAALAARSQYVGAAFGFYGTGRMVYSRYIAHGDDVAFPKDTRIEVVLSPERANALKPPAR
jgi:hypothetical protein